MSLPRPWPPSPSPTPSSSAMKTTSSSEFAVRNDKGCGFITGPILASGVGIRTVDCGIPQL
ncbi:putative aspartyl aminopeptidase [Iris pallida]|uniref:aspartyl aminopeptidase n=1 Tax=Iris pallida TaxID=29817 RepID=A0AAX6DGY0_IRIPA|nr:putative aspartyl aminopeptidase [Iris pallida]